MKPTSEDNRKGWFLVFLQFFFAAIIITTAYFEASFLNHRYIALLEVIGIILLIISVLTFLYAVVSFKQIITPNPIPMDNAKLITTGIYSSIRHPMYLFGILLTFGYSFYRSAYFTLILCFFYIFFFIYKIKFEEKHLIQKFPEYSSYRESTKKLIPFIY